MSKIPTPNLDPSLGPDESACGSLASELAGIVDDARQIVTDLGLSPYRAFIVQVRWSGGAVGRGTASVVSQLELLPTPQLYETSGVRGEQRSGGEVERGTLELRRISARYTEDQLHGLFCCGDHAPPKSDQVFVEVRVAAGTRRRFTVTGMPYLHARGFEWRVRLLRQDEDRDRAGSVPDVGMRDE